MRYVENLTFVKCTSLVWLSYIVPQGSDFTFYTQVWSLWILLFVTAWCKKTIKFWRLGIQSEWGDRTSRWKKTKVKDEDKYDFSNKSQKENEVQTKSVYVTVEVKEVSKTYDIVVNESMKDRINEELLNHWN